METVEQTHQPMAATQIRVRTPQRRKVDIKNRDELMMWCRRLGVTPFQLCSAVARVGNEVTSVQHALRAR